MESKTLKRLTDNRLPTVEEMEKLLKKAKSGESTLDYWAGYSLNPDDARALLEKVGELGGGPVLLTEVGRMEPAGDNPVFDLGGNAADSRPPDRYVGFRVVRATSSVALCGPRKSPSP